jgi:penicillin V acylase-like amidase (Ntn superfamily)
MATKIATMRTLQGHANMLTLHHVFEDAEGFHVVVEFCKGKALLESIHDRVSGLHTCYTCPARHL